MSSSTLDKAKGRVKEAVGALTHDHCAVCSVTHTMAVPAGEAPAPARPSLAGPRLAATPTDAPTAIACAIPRGRAPPAA